MQAFAERGERFEWKLHGHDRPDDLPQRLRAAGFVPEETETIVIAPVAHVAGEVRLPREVSLREVTRRADFERIAALEQAVWGDEGQRSWLVAAGVVALAIAVSGLAGVLPGGLGRGDPGPSQPN